MSADEAYLKLKNYFETRPAARTALSALREDVEIGLTIGGMVDCALFQKDGQPQVERRLAQNPDLIFHIRPESVDVLSSQPTDDVGDIGINVLKEILAGNIQVKMVGSFFSIVSNGYLEIMKKGGKNFSAFLATKGFSSFGKITSAIKNLRGQP